MNGLATGSFRVSMTPPSGMMRRTGAAFATSISRPPCRPMPMVQPTRPPTHRHGHIQPPRKYDPSLPGVANPSSASRGFASAPPPPPAQDGYDEQEGRRNKSIRMHPQGHGQRILPGNYVIKTNKNTGEDRRVFLEHALGFFWAIKELQLTDNKPIISNESIIPAAEAELFPTLQGLCNLEDDVVAIPEFFIRNNQSKDATAQCTLVSISYKDFGSKQLSSWTQPFEEVLCRGEDASRYEVVNIAINDGWMIKMLSRFIISGTKKRVSVSDHNNTLLFFGDAEEFKDVLRMHNVYSGYVFLVDGLGRVRWAGSGEGSEEEVRILVDSARELTRPPEQHVRQIRGDCPPKPRVGRKVNKISRK